MSQYQDFPELIQTCSETHDDTSDAMMCAYCGIENADYKDFVHAFCETGIDPSTLCSDVRFNQADQLLQDTLKDEREVKWTTGKDETSFARLTLRFPSNRSRRK